MHKHQYYLSEVKQSRGSKVVAQNPEYPIHTPRANPSDCDLTELLQKLILQCEMNHLAVRSEQTIATDIRNKTKVLQHQKQKNRCTIVTAARP